jgi:hypothetical protein
MSVIRNRRLSGLAAGKIPGLPGFNVGGESQFSGVVGFAGRYFL